MARLNPITPEKANGETKQIYANLQKKMGKVINIFQHMGNSPAALKGFLALSEAAEHTSLSPQIREEIALVVGQTNQCQYCLSAHTFLGGKAGLSQDLILKARKGESPDPKTQAILQFVKSAVEKRGNVSDQEVAKLKAAGVSEAEIAEIVMLITVNIFTNYFNLIAGTPVDFPEAPKLQMQEKMAGAR